MNHQAEGVDWILRTPKALLADDVGLGKTPQALAAISALLVRGELPHRHGAAKDRKLCRALWLTDASLIDQTRAEAERFVPKMTVLAGTDPALGSSGKAQRLMQAVHASGVDVLILSYEMACSRRDWLGNFAPSMLVLDEVSSVKGQGKLFDAVCQLSSRTPRVLSLTATPMENSPTELWAVLRATDTPGLWSAPEFNERFVQWRTSFVDQWGKAHRSADGWLAHNIGEVRQYLAAYVLRRTLESAGVEGRLPRRVGPTVREVPLSPEQEQGYKAAQGLKRRDAVQRMEVASLFGGSNPPMVEALLEELSKHPQESAIVYCGALEMLNIVEHRLLQDGITVCRIEGKVSESDRRAAIRRHRDGSARVLLASRVLEYGLNLQHCRLLFSLDTSWNPARESQREGRLRRLGSPHDTYEHLAILPATSLSSAKAAKLARKDNAAKLVGLA